VGLGVDETQIHRASTVNQHLLNIRTRMTSMLVLNLTVTVCVECLIGKQKKPTLFNVTEPSSVPYRTPPACAKMAAYPVTVHGLFLLTKITKQLHGTHDVHYARLIKSVQADTLRAGLIGLVDARPGNDLSAVRLNRK
jgi:hypothetical protein